MAKLSKDKRDKLILVAMGTITIDAGLWYGVIKTRQGALADVQSRRVKALDKLDKARHVVSSGVQSESAMESATNQLKKVEETMASGDLFTWSYRFLDQAKAGYDVSFVDVGRPGRGDIGVIAQFPYEAAIFTVRGDAYFHEFGKFLAGFENRNPYFRVQNLTLTSGAEGTGATDGAGESKLSFKLDFVCLIRPNP
jgi:hypothetical protein